MSVTAVCAARRQPTMRVTAFVVLAAGLVVACSDQGPESPTVASVLVSPASNTLEAFGETVQLSATARTADGRVIEGMTFVWTSSDQTIATVDASGLVNAEANGTSQITATTAGASGSADVSVEQAITSLSIAATADTIRSLGDTTRYQVTALDALGSQVMGRPFSWISSDTAVARIDSTGLATAVGEGVTQVSVTVDGLVANGTLTVWQVPVRLGIVTGPAGAESGQPFTSQPTIRVLDGGGSLVTADDSTEVTAALASGTGSLSGTFNVTVSSGQATYADLAITGGTGNFTVAFSAPGLMPDTSEILTLAPGVVSSSQSVVTVSSDTVTATASATLTLRARDASGSDLVSGGLSVSFFQSGGTSSGAIGATTDGGDGSYTASFTGNTAGTATMIGAIMNGDTVTSPTPSITVAPAAAGRLAFNTAPANAVVGTAIGPTVQITAFDPLGNVATNFTGEVTISIGTNPGGAVLAGTTAAVASAGIASFTDLTLNRSGAGYTLIASATGIVKDTSAQFDIRPAPATRLGFTTQPADVESGVVIAPAVVVAALDPLGNVDTSYTAMLTLSLATNPAAGILSGTSLVAAVSGIATFPDLAIDAFGSGYVLGVSSGTLTTDVSAPFVVTPPATTASWVGGTSSDWSDASNWSAGAAPAAGDNVYIPATATAPIVLTADVAIAALYVDDGATLNLGTFTLTTTGNVRAGATITGTGTVILAGTGTTVSGTMPSVTVQGTVTAESAVAIAGNLNVTGTLDVGGNRVTVQGDFATTVGGTLHMLSAADTLSITGAATFGGWRTDTFLTAGVLEVGGNFNQLTSTFGSNQPELTFAPSGTHTTIFNGSATQTVSFQNPAIGFQNVTFTNPGGVVFATRATVVAGARITQGTVTGSIGRITLTDALTDVAGGRWQVDTTEVRGPSPVLPDSIQSLQLIFSDSSGLAKGFTLLGNAVVTGHLALEGQSMIVRGTFATSGGGVLRMQNVSDRLRISGEATFGGWRTDTFLTAGVLEVGGNFNQLTSTFGSNQPELTFAPSGTHTTIFNGSATQNVSFQNPTIGFQNVTFANPGGVVFATRATVVAGAKITLGTVTGSIGRITLTDALTDVAGGRWQVDTTEVRGRSPVLPDSIKSLQLIFSDSSGLAKGFTLLGDAVVTGHLALEGQSMIVRGTFATSGGGVLRMQNVSDTLRISGDATFGGWRTDTFLTAGVLEVGGNFNQLRSTFGSNRPDLTFAPSGTHATVFNGSATQTVSFQNPTIGFQNVTFANPGGVVFATRATVVAGAKITQGTVTGPQVTLLGNIADAVGGRWKVDTTLVSGTDPSLPDSLESFLSFPVNSRIAKSFTVLGDVSVFGQLNLGGHRVLVRGDFATVRGAFSGGTLVMQDPADTLRVVGNVSFGGSNTSTLLTAGTLEIGGNFDQLRGLQGSFIGNTYVPSGTHTTVFNGTGMQTVSFAHPGNSNFQHMNVAAGSAVTLSTNMSVLGNLDLRGSLSVPIGVTVTITQTLFLRSGAVVTNNGTVNRGACVVEAGVTINGIDPCL